MHKKYNLRKVKICCKKLLEKSEGIKNRQVRLEPGTACRQAWMGQNFHIQSGDRPAEYYDSEAK